MSNVMRTRRQAYTRSQSSQQQLSSASQPQTPSDTADRTIDIYERQRVLYNEYHEECREALADLFGENPDRNWNYIERLRRIWEAGNQPSSTLSFADRLRLTNDQEVRTTIQRLYNQYSLFPSLITNDFETPRRSNSRLRVSFSRNAPITETSSEPDLHTPERPIHSTPRNTSRILDPRLTLSADRNQPRISEASTSGITPGRGIPRPSARPSMSAPSPSPFEASAQTLNSLVEPAEGEYRLSAPVIHREEMEGYERPESPGISHRQRIQEREQTTPRVRESTPRTPTEVTTNPPRIPQAGNEVSTSAPPTPYVVHRIYPDISSFMASDPGTGRRENEPPERLNQAETIEEIFEQDRRNQQQTEEPNVTLPSTMQSRIEEVEEVVQRPPSRSSSDEYESLYADSYQISNTRRYVPREKIEGILRETVRNPDGSQKRVNNSEVSSGSDSPPSPQKSSPSPPTPPTRPPKRPCESTSPSSSGLSEQSSDKTLIEPDEELLARRPHLVEELFGDIDPEYAEMYYDRDWRYPSDIPDKYKYVFGKTPGRRIDAWFERFQPHRYYPIPIDADDNLNRDMPAYVPRARGPLRMSQLPTEEEEERQPRSSMRQPPEKDVPPHMDRDARNAQRSASRGRQWKQQRETEPTPIRESVSTTKPAWRKVMDETPGIHHAAFERSRRPYRWSGVPANTTPAAASTSAAAAAAPEPNPPDSSDDDDEDPRDRGRSGRHGGMGGVPPTRDNSRDQGTNRPSGSGGMGGGGGPPEDPGDDPYDDRESEDSEGFPHHPYWPPYGRYFRTKPPHPKANINAADYYGIPYYQY